MTKYHGPILNPKKSEKEANDDLKIPNSTFNRLREEVDNSRPLLGALETVVGNFRAALYKLTPLQREVYERLFIREDHLDDILKDINQVTVEDLQCWKIENIATEARWKIISLLNTDDPPSLPIRMCEIAYREIGGLRDILSVIEENIAPK